ncbi:MAG: hypothetical protein H6662_06660 [Ardenticatenaceae bacterium]|nr:hypothetical protein [Ardenticatenaceae bacterium]MCB8990612.1 hypothetical protein [Ardenticatenaceae bacterium]MCB9004319.1 hypothetical protein [Ardenticatenaceae bacterium]
MAFVPQALTAVQLQQLQAWATAELGDAPPPHRATAVHLIIELADELLLHLDEPVDEVIDDAMIRLLKNLRWLTGQPLTAAQRQQWRAFNRYRPGHDREHAFPHLLAILNGNEE